MYRYSNMTHSTSPKGKDFNGARQPQLTDPLQIGAVRLENRLVQAPMAGISGRAFRLQARRFGVGLTATEMISSYGLHYANRRTAEMLQISAGEHPVAVQLFGTRPDLMAEAARAAEAAGADIIDINMGCPARKVIKTGAGAALMRDEQLAADIVSAMSEAVRVPVTVKMRSGFSDVTATSLALKLQEAGAAAIFIHPRTAAQGWRGKADHRVTAELADRLDVPLVASGDVGSPADAAHLLERAGAAAVMIGRAALGNPWLFSDMLSGREPYRRLLAEVLDELELFFADVAAEMGEARGIRYMRKFFAWYLRPFALPRDVMERARRASDFSETMRLIRETA
jgi:nifR3 family TIM-barrel protein